MGTSNKTYNRLGIDIGSTTVKVAILDSEDKLYFPIINAILQIFRKHLPNF